VYIFSSGLTNEVLQNLTPARAQHKTCEKAKGHVTVFTLSFALCVSDNYCSLTDPTNEQMHKVKLYNGQENIYIKVSKNFSYRLSHAS